MRIHTALKSAIVAFALGFCLPLSAQSADDKSANLIIAGGGLSADTAPIWQAFIDKAQGDGPFVIIPAASGSPAGSAASVKETLMKYGVDAERIKIAPLALKDDPDTPDVNEAKWKRNANDPKTLDLVKTASAIWFTGGDQSRITQILLMKDGQDTPVMGAIRDTAARGVPIGGTSAGAAIMSQPMILQGDSLKALISQSNGEPLKTGNGLGFFTKGLVDQHFGERARLGRLLVALTEFDTPEARFGFGIDEDTALIVDGDGTARVEGAGYVTLIDARKAKFKRLENGQLSASGVTLHMMSAGDVIDLTSFQITPAEWKKATVRDEYIRKSLPGGGGMALPGQTLQYTLGEGLVDNRESRDIERISFDSQGRGVGFVFSQTSASQGFWGRGQDGKGRYSIANIRFDLVPLVLSMETLK